MSSARIELEPGWLLSQKPYRETSELLEVLTLRHGRVGLVARGLRGPRARQRGIVGLFRPLLLSWLEKGELGTLTAVEADGPELLLPGERLIHGWYLNELLLKLLQRHDPHPDLLADYIVAVRCLSSDHDGGSRSGAADLREAPAGPARLRIAARCVDRSTGLFPVSARPRLRALCIG